jgi:hypothetical protein
MKAHAILAALILAAPTAAFAKKPHVIISAGVYPGYYGHSPYYYPSSHYYYRPYGYYQAPPVYRASRYYAAGDYSLDATVQRELRHRGYYRGPIDGDIGPGSRSAIRQYQADHGLRVTGRIDSSLLRSLGI